MDVRTCHNCRRKVADHFKDCPFCKSRLTPVTKPARQIKSDTKEDGDHKTGTPSTTSTKNSNTKTTGYEWLILFTLIFGMGYCALVDVDHEAEVEPEMTAAQKLSRDKGMARAGAQVALKQILRDPDSYQEIKHAVIAHKTDKNILGVYLKYRSKNGFGGYVVNEAGLYCRRGTYNCSLATDD